MAADGEQKYGNVARMGDRRGVYTVLVGRDYSEDLGIDGITILKWIFRRWDRETWTGLLWLRLGRGCGREPTRAQISSASRRKSKVTQMAGSRECGIRPLASITCGEFLD